MNAASTDPAPVPVHLGSTECLNAEVYAELRRIAHRRMSSLEAGSTLQATVLVHEAWLRLSRRSSPWQNRQHFLAGAVTAMRHILLDHARYKSRLRHGGGLQRSVALALEDLASPTQDERLLIIEEAVRALEQVDPFSAQIVVARFYGGLTNREIAETLGIGERSVDRHWASAKIWLYRWMQGTTRT